MRYIIFLFCLILFFSSCEKYDLHEKEIRVIDFKLGNEINHSSQGHYLYYDSRYGYMSSDTIRGNRLYFGKLKLWHFFEATIGGENLDWRFIEQGAVHQVFYEISDSLDIDIIYNDLDFNDMPIGFETLIEVGNPSSGTLTVNLVRNPNKTAEGVAEGNMLNAGGTIHYSHTFDVAIK